MSSLKRIIWLKTIFSEDYVKKSPAVSPAANLWQHKFIDNLKKLNIDIFCVGHNHERSFPNGKFFVKTLKKDLVRDIKNKSFDYINLPYLRDLFLRKKYYDYLKNFCFKKGDVILTYNDSFLSFVASKIKSDFNIPWISIVADLKAPKKSSGYVYFNWNYYKKNKSTTNKIHIDGGINLRLANTKVFNKNKNKIILYAGTIGGHAGVSYLIEAFNKIKDPNVELWLCGKGSFHNIKKLVNKDKRIKFLGYVSKGKLDELCNRADIFVNPRKSDGNDTNFPSKILFYLSFKKPIISSKCGLSPKYNNILFLLSNEKVKTLTRKINQILYLNSKQTKKIKRKISNFNKKNTWDIQARKFVIWCDKIFNS